MTTNHGSDRGKRASFDRKSGEVSGSGAGAGNVPGDREDYDSDLDEAQIAGQGGAAAAGSPRDR